MQACPANKAGAHDFHTTVVGDEKCYNKGCGFTVVIGGEVKRREAAQKSKGQVVPGSGVPLSLEGTIQARFEHFHSKHPVVYEELVALARQGKQAGATKMAIDMLFNVLRWHRIIEGLPDQTEDFKLNDHYRSRYARLIMASEPDLQDIFEIRELKAN